MDITEVAQGYVLIYGDWKLIVRVKGKPELFNVAADPYEKNNLSATELQREADLQQLLNEQQAKDDPDLPTDLKDQPRQVTRYRILGVLAIDRLQQQIDSSVWH